MDIFSQINAILYKEKANVDFSDFAPYMVSRWISMHSPQMAILMNKTANIEWRQLKNDKELWFKYLNAVVKKQPRQRLEYIKKEKKEKTSTREKDIEELSVFLGKALELSQREVKYFLEQHDDIKTLKKQFLNKQL